MEEQELARSASKHMIHGGWASRRMVNVISMVSSNNFSSSALSLMLSSGASVPFLALHSNGNHDVSIFSFFCLRFSLLPSSVSSTSRPISLACLNKNAAYLNN
ncbi:hypothetical protein SCA6_006733 [Theobroma cacao]